MSEYTNFHGYSHGDMRSMVQSMDSGGVMAAGDPWRKATETLKQIRTALNVASADATSSWEGSTSDAFYSKMTKLANAVNNAAAYANDAAAAMQMMSEAIDTAKRDMPEEPSWLDKAGDAISDTAKTTVGVDDEDTRTAVTDEKKAQAVAVMETLASKYRATTNYLKPPKKLDVSNDVEDLQPPDSGGTGALGALIMGGGMGLAGSGQPGGSVAPSQRSSGPRLTGSPSSPKAASPGPADPGIKGGTANPSNSSKSPVATSPGTGIDGVHVGSPGGKTGVFTPGGAGGGLGPGSNGHAGGGISGGLDLKGGNTTSGSGAARGTGSTGSQKGLNGGAGGGTGRAAGAGGSSARGGTAGFGAGGMDGHNGLGRASGGGAGSDRRASSGLVRKGGGLVGESGSGGTGKQAFTEGGSGLGRARGQGGSGTAGQSHGMPGGTQAGKKDKKQGKERPDYLVEDEETWAPGQTVNPNVVE